MNEVNWTAGASLRERTIPAEAGIQGRRGGATSQARAPTVIPAKAGIQAAPGPGQGAHKDAPTGTNHSCGGRNPGVARRGNTAGTRASRHSCGSRNPGGAGPGAGRPQGRPYGNEPFLRRQESRGGAAGQHRRHARQPSFLRKPESRRRRARGRAPTRTPLRERTIPASAGIQGRRGEATPQARTPTVIPAEAGIQGVHYRMIQIPAFAGMTINVIAPGCCRSYANVSLHGHDRPEHFRHSWRRQESRGGGDVARHIDTGGALTYHPHKSTTLERR